MAKKVTDEKPERVSREFVQAQGKFNTVVASILSVSVAYHALSRRAGQPDQKDYINNLTKQLRALDDSLQGINKEMDANINTRKEDIVKGVEAMNPSKIILMR